MQATYTALLKEKGTVTTCLPFQHYNSDNNNTYNNSDNSSSSSKNNNSKLSDGEWGVRSGGHMPLVSAQSHAPCYYESLFYGVSGLVVEETIIWTIKTVPIIIRSGRHVTVP